MFQQPQRGFPAGGTGDRGGDRGRRAEPHSGPAAGDWSVIFRRPGAPVHRDVPGQGIGREAFMDCPFGPQDG